MTATQDILSPAAPSSGGGDSAPSRADFSPLRNHDLNALRNVLLVNERAQIKKILHRLDDPATRAEELARILPQAIALRSLEDSVLAEALRPALSAALASALKERPDLLIAAVRAVLKEALFKPWGPLAAALRRPIFHRHRASRHIARIEQLLLIDRPSGKLLQQSALAPGDPGNARHLQEQRSIAAMLASFRTFLQDPQYLLHYLQLGQLRIEEFTYGIHATDSLLLLSVIRAPIHSAPAELLKACQELLGGLDPANPALPPLPLASGPTEPVAQARDPQAQQNP